jgi:hypothetical protein
VSPREIGEWIVFVAAVVGALGVIGRMVIRPLVRFGRRVETTLDAVRNDLLPNGGGSLRDAVDRIENRQLSIEQRVCLLETAIVKPTPAARRPRTKQEAP